MGQFEYDAMNDQLPTVSWILPPSGFDEHPAALPAAGATFVASKIDAIAANPEVWAKTVFILSYDENDGMFDHVIPPTPKPGTPGEFVFKTSNTGVDGAGLPVGLGFRVPCIIISPWTTGGYVFSETSDHTSQLRLLEHITGVKETNISDWRRKTVGDLTGAFRFGNAGRNILDGPGFAEFNLSLFKNFYFERKGSLQFRWEVFNALNHANLNLPNINVNEPTGGTITASGTGRLMQFGLRYRF